MATTHHDMAHHEPISATLIGKRIETIGWALALVWGGISMLMAFGWPGVMIGLGLIAVAMQAVRAYNQLPVEGPWAIVGLVLLAAGLWQIFGPAQVALLPIALIVAGVALVGRLFWPDPAGSRINRDI